MFPVVFHLLLYITIGEFHMKVIAEKTFSVVQWLLITKWAFYCPQTVAQLIRDMSAGVQVSIVAKKKRRRKRKKEESFLFDSLVDFYICFSIVTSDYRYRDPTGDGPFICSIHQILHQQWKQCENTYTIQSIHGSQQALIRAMDGGRGKHVNRLGLGLVMGQDLV